MLPDPFNQVRGHSDVKDGVVLISKDVDMGGAHRLSYQNSADCFAAFAMAFSWIKTAITNLKSS